MKASDFPQVHRLMKDREELKNLILGIEHADNLVIGRDSWTLRLEPKEMEGGRMFMVDLLKARLRNAEGVLRNLGVDLDEEEN